MLHKLRVNFRAGKRIFPAVAEGGVRSRTAPSPASSAPATPHRARGPENTAPSVLEGPGAQVAQRVATVSHKGRASCKYYRIAVCDLDLAGTTHWSGRVSMVTALVRAHIVTSDITGGPSRRLLRTAPRFPSTHNQTQNKLWGRTFATFSAI